MTFYISISEVYVHFIPVFPHTHTKSYEPHTRSSGGLVFFWGDVIMSCWFSCFYATLLPWPRAVIKQQAYKKTIAPVHFRRLCQGFNSEINSEETFMNVLMAAPESQLIGWECFYNLFVSGDTLLLQISLVAHVNVGEDWSDHRRGQQLNWNKSFIREQYLVYRIHGGGGIIVLGFWWGSSLIWNSAWN